MIKWLASIVGSIFSLKGFLSIVFMSILGIIFYNLLVEVIQEVMNFTINQLNGSGIGGVSTPTLSGFAGWCATQLKLPECVSVIGSALAIKFILRKIPFLKW